MGVSNKIMKIPKKNEIKDGIKIVVILEIPDNRAVFISLFLMILSKKNIPENKNTNIESSSKVLGVFAKVKYETMNKKLSKFLFLKKIISSTKLISNASDKKTKKTTKNVSKNSFDRYLIIFIGIKLFLFSVSLII
jgi:hypothetical protein